MKIKKSQLPRGMVPETKFKDLTGTMSSALNRTQIRMFNGNDGDDFNGAQCTIIGLDITCLLGASDSRLTIVVPKDPSIVPSGTPPQNRYDHREYTILFDEVISSQDRTIYRKKMKLNLPQRYSNTGAAVLHNNLYVLLNSETVSTTTVVTRVYFTDN